MWETSSKEGRTRETGKEEAGETATAAKPLPLAVSREKAKDRTKNAAFAAATMTKISKYDPYD